MVAETQQRANDAETLRYIGAARDLLRDADSHVRLRTYKDAGTDEYGALADSIGEILGLARVALSLAGSAEAAGREYQMITVHIRERRAYGGQTVWKVTAPTIQKALAAVPGDVVFPLQPEEFFTGAAVSARKSRRASGTVVRKA